MGKQNLHTYVNSAFLLNGLCFIIGGTYLSQVFNFAILGLTVDLSVDTINGLLNIFAHTYTKYHKIISYTQNMLYLLAGIGLIVHNATHTHLISSVNSLYVLSFLSLIICCKIFILYNTRNLISEPSISVIQWDSMWDIVYLSATSLPIILPIFGYKASSVDWYAGMIIGGIMIIQGCLLMKRV